MRRTMIVAGASPLALALAFGASSAWAQLGGIATTPTVPPELPVEIETELGPGSLKQAPLWKELVQLLEAPYAPVVRRPGFGATMPGLNVIPLGLNFLTDQPLRLRTSDGEVSWDQPGPLFDPEQTAESLDADGNGTPDLLRTRIGALVASEDDALDDGDLERLAAMTGVTTGDNCFDCGYLIVHNPDGHPAIPPNGTVVAVPAFFSPTTGAVCLTRATPGCEDAVLHELDPATQEYEEVVELEAPINEQDFLRAPGDVRGLGGRNSRLRQLADAGVAGRAAAEVLGKAFFWDMQVGSDGVQSCGTCHFHAGVDNRARNSLNPNHLGGNATSTTLEVKGPNGEVTAADFPFRRLEDLDGKSEGPGASAVVRDHDDVLSSMGVRFRQFADIPPIGAGSFLPAVNGVRPLRPDVACGDAGTTCAPVPEPLPLAFQGLRRVEPRNTPTMHSAAFNFDNFWDGRARFHFNGGSVFGHSDPTAHVFYDGDLGLVGATNGHIRPDLLVEDPEVAEQPVRIKFSSLASQAVGPPLSDFEMSFAGRNHAKIGKKLFQDGVTPLANQLVSVTDSRLGPFSWQGGSRCPTTGPNRTAPGKPGLCISYTDLVRLAFAPQYHGNTAQHLVGAPDATDPFDGYGLTIAGGPAAAGDRDQFTQMEANFSLLFGLSVQTYEQLLIPDDTPFDRFMDLNPLAANGVAQPGEQGTLPPSTVRALVTGSETGNLILPAGFGPDELFGFDVFAGANLTAALPAGSPRNPAGVGSNPFIRTARCMLCHIGPEQTDHSINISHGLIKGGAEYELPVPPLSPEPTGPFATVGGLVLEEEIAETAQDVIELEPRDMGMADDPSTPWDERVVSVPSAFAFGDQGIYNIGLRPIGEDVGRGGADAYGWPLSMSTLALMNIAGNDGEPCEDAVNCFHPGDAPADNPFVIAGIANPPSVMTNFDPSLPAGGLFEEAGEGAVFPGTTHELESINPGFDKTPVTPLLPEYMAHWLSDLPAGELHPQIDELGFLPNTITKNDGGPAIEFGELLFGADLHCAVWSGNLPAGTPGAEPPRWGALDTDANGVQFFRDDLCPNLQSSVAGNLEDTLHGTWPFPNRVGRMGAFKAPQLRNVELTGPYFHTGSYLTLRQVVDFYMRAGDFPITNGEFRDQHIIDASSQVFAFGATTVADDPAYAQFAGGLPDTVTRYGPMPDTNPAGGTPEYATQEDAKVSLVKFLLSLTDDRVRYERAPFDRPELFVPMDGLAPDNTAGRARLVTLSGTPCTATSTGTCFQRLTPVGAEGNATPAAGFLGVTSNPNADCTTEISHFCR